MRKVTTRDNLEAETFAVAKRIAAKPPEALRLSRGLLRDSSDTLATRIDVEAKLFGERLTSHEARAAFMAFFAKKAG